MSHYLVCSPNVCGRIKMASQQWIVIAVLSLVTVVLSFRVDYNNPNGRLDSVWNKNGLKEYCHDFVQLYIL